MSDALFSGSIFRSLSLSAASSSSLSVPASAISISSEDSISSSEDEEEEVEGTEITGPESFQLVDGDDENDIVENHVGPMNLFPSASVVQNPRQATTNSSKPPSNHHQTYHPSHNPLLDIEEATPPATSQRLDQSRRRSNNTNIHSNNVGSDEHHHSQQQVIVDDEIKAVIGKPPQQANTRSTIAQAPLSTNTPLIGLIKKGSVEPRLVHPLLEKCPLQFRFIITGVLSNILFMIVYNEAVSLFIQNVSAPTIYSIVYLAFIPISHLMTILFVFGWPDHYFHSLASNLPIGLTAIGIGSVLTSYLDHIKFNHTIEEYIYDNWTFRKMPNQRQEFVNEKSEFYSSLVVLVVTSVWTYVLSIWINSMSTKSDKKEL